jgi:cathepsin S
MIKSLKDRPLSVVISVHPSFLFYSEGIINICGNKINHSLQLVGLRQNEKGNIYIVKNSWGIQWGDKGYGYFDASINNGNICSICSYPQIPF